ncbi:MAG: hypothetical protein AAF990_27105 [Bacteroidota bacterium]
MKYLTFFGLLLFSLPLFSQNAADLIGNWTVSKAELSESGLQDDQMQAMQILEGKIKAASFEFEEDGRFTFDFDDTNMRIDDGFWKLDADRKLVYISTWEGKADLRPLLLAIQILEHHGDRMTVHLLESPIKLRLVKG